MKIKTPVTGRTGAPWSASRRERDPERLAFAVGFSLFAHAAILSIVFGIAGFGLPGLPLPWAEQRLTVRLVDAPRPPPPAPEAAPVPLPVPPRVPPKTVTAERPKPATPSRADSAFEVQSPSAEAVPVPAPLSVPRRETRAAAPAAKARARDRQVRPKPLPQILAQKEPQEEPFNVPPPNRAKPEPQRAPESAAKKQSEEPPPAVQATEQAARAQAEEAARLQEEEAVRQRAEEDARQRALALQNELEAKKQAEARRLEEAKKQEEARRQALELEARKLAEEAARQKDEELARQRALALQKEEEAKKLAEAQMAEETRKLELARKEEELKKQEAARRLALESEALRRAEEAAQQAAARKKELDAQRQLEEAKARAKEIAERAEAQAAQRERERLAAERPPALPPGTLSGSEIAAKAIDQLRTPGAPRGDPARPPSPFARDMPRRRSLIGPERDVALRLYGERWRSKTERNGTLNYRRSASLAASDNPIVTVSIRSDGSLEDVAIHRSSGVREIDEAVRRIARLYAPYSAFPPDLARQYDVIEIRRVSFFDPTLRILDELY